MAALASIVAKFLAWDSSDAGTSVNDEGLWLSVRAKVHRDVVVHEVGRVAIQWSRE